MEQQQQPTAVSNTPKGPYYYIDSSQIYTKSSPHPTQDLISLYNLTKIANSVARVNEDGTKGVKLRKSYKAHISDLAGKQPNIPKDKTISPVVYAPDREGAPIQIKTLDPKALSQMIKFSKTPESGIPGFDPADLGISDGASNKRKMKGQGLEDPKRRRME